MSKEITRFTHLITCEGNPLAPTHFGVSYEVLEDGKIRENLLEMDFAEFDGTKMLSEVLEIAVDAVEAEEGVEVSLGDVRERNFLVATYDARRRLETETWYETDLGAGEYSGIVEKTTYTYVLNYLSHKTIQLYWADGTPRGDPIVWKYYRNPTTAELVMKKEESL